MDTMPGFRQTLSNMLRTAVESAIEHDDQKYGRQLASQLERQAMILRVNFGGNPLWSTYSKAIIGRRKRPE